ncbi:hypothetical protein QVD17_39484 [Tagetes erecta]|uniref:Reverse transcriptase domain-containing protein n=1 Tax=Tagetes erecta TaxID=13708 RepID=A0AAD8JNM7_TARER|nr:hypothetical protein QVD17_39484 [Tagetes erecta]
MLKADGIDAGSAKGRTNEMVKNLKEPGEGLNETGEVGEETGDVQNDPSKGGGETGNVGEEPGNVEEEPGEVGNAYTAKDEMKVGDMASAKNAYTASGDLKNVYTANINNAYTIRAANVCDHTARNNDHRTKGDAFIDPVVSHNAKDVGVESDQLGTKLNFRYMVNAESKQGFDVVLPKDSIRAVCNKLEFYFLGDRMAYPVESKLLASFNEAILDEERFLKQKAKVHWLAEGDANTKYFHNTLKCRNHRARIDVITDSNGSLHEGKAVPKAFVDHYVGFLGKEDISIIPITPELFDVRIDQVVAVDMIREVTMDEIKRTMFAFGDDKAPGPDGFTAA